MEISGGKVVVAAKPSSATGFLDALEKAHQEFDRREQQLRDTEKKCAAMIASAQAEAANIIAVAQKEADRIKGWIDQVTKSVGPLADEILNG
jgi:cell division septum initiation protein DivIVA